MQRLLGLLALAFAACGVWVWWIGVERADEEPAAAVRAAMDDATASHPPSLGGGTSTVIPNAVTGARSTVDSGVGEAASLQLPGSSDRPVLTGRLLDPDGEPMPLRTALLILYVQGDKVAGRLELDLESRFVWRLPRRATHGLEGPIVVWVLPSVRRIAEPRNGLRGTIDVPETLPVGVTRLGTIETNAARTLLAGRVVRPDLEPVPWVNVFVRESGEEALRAATPWNPDPGPVAARTDGMGWFEVLGFLDEDAELSLELEVPSPGVGLVPTKVAFASGALDAVVRLDASPFVAGRVKGPAEVTELLHLEVRNSLHVLGEAFQPNVRRQAVVALAGTPVFASEVGARPFSLDGIEDDTVELVLSFRGRPRPLLVRKGVVPALSPSDPAANLELALPEDFELFELPIRRVEPVDPNQGRSIELDGNGETTARYVTRTLSGRLRGAGGPWESFFVLVDENGEGRLLLAEDAAPYDLEFSDPERDFLRLGPGDSVTIE